MNLQSNTYIQRKAIAPTAARLGWRYEGDLLIMPYWSPDGEPLGERVRKPDGKRLYRRGSKWRKHPDKRMYHLPNIADKIFDTVYLVEGESDTATMIEAGYPNTAGIFGVTNVPHDLVTILEGWQARRVITLFDADNAGETARRLVTDKLLGTGIKYRHANVGWKDGCNDVNDLWVQGKADKLHFMTAIADCIELSTMARAPLGDPVLARLGHAADALLGGKADTTAAITSATFGALCATGMPKGELHVTAYAPQFERDFTPAEMLALLSSKGYKITAKTVARALARSPIIDKVSYSKYRVTDVATFDMRLFERLIIGIQKRIYGRKLPLQNYAELSSVGESLHDHIETKHAHLSKKETAKAKARVEAETRHFINALHEGDFELPTDLRVDDLRAWWWKRKLPENTIATRSEIYRRTGFDDQRQRTIQCGVGAVSDARYAYVEADSAVEACEMHSEPCFAMYVDNGQHAGKYKLQLPNRYGYEGGEVDTLKADKESRRTFSHPRKAKKKLGSENVRVQKPILPKVKDTDTIQSESFITNALYNTLIDMGITTATEWAGKEVTLEAIEAYLAAIPEPADMIELDDGTEIPF